MMTLKVKIIIIHFELLGQNHFIKHFDILQILINLINILTYVLSHDFDLANLIYLKIITLKGIILTY